MVFIYLTNKYTKKTNNNHNITVQLFYFNRFKKKVEFYLVQILIGIV